MASLVLGVGSSHGPTMHSLPENWRRLGVEDEQDPRFDFTRLQRRTEIESELTPEKMQERYDLIQQAIADLSAVLHDANPDVVILLSNPHGGVGGVNIYTNFGF
jgi:hypothetical protein